MLLFERYKRLIYASCYRALQRCGLAEDAEDVVQETFMRAYWQINQFDETKPDANFGAWLSTIARNRCLDLWRKRRREVVTADPSDQAVIHSLSLETIDLLEDALSALPEIVRRCWLLFKLDGYTYKEIAQMTGYSVRQVEDHLSKARQKLGVS